jgi:hypothetical protein
MIKKWRKVEDCKGIFFVIICFMLLFNGAGPTGTDMANWPDE